MLARLGILMLFGAALFAFGHEQALGQATSATRTPSPPPDDEEDEPLVSDSGVGYIDPAFLADRIRFRFDAAYDNVQPSRAEFFWAANANGGAGGPVVGPGVGGQGSETRVDYQDFSLYLESVIADRWSVFGEAPLRLVNPEVSDNSAGLGDSNVGVKYALSDWVDWATTLQLRVYIPSGADSRGLGNGHASLEPGVLLYRQLSERIVLEGELRDWIPIEGSDFAGNVLRYGLGASYNLRELDELPIRAVVEFVGWTVLDGKSALAISPTDTLIRDAAGDTIVNVKAGFRWWLTEEVDFYAGYGRAMTTQTWYDDVIRFELRKTF